MHQVDRSSLAIDQQVSAIVLAMAEGALFGQLKGSYHKLKIKGAPAGLSIGSICNVKLTKVSREKMVGDFTSEYVEEDTHQ